MDGIDYTVSHQMGCSRRREKREAFGARKQKQNVICHIVMQPRGGPLRCRFSKPKIDLLEG